MSGSSYKFRFDADPVYYALTDSDLERLRSSAENLDKDFFLGLFPTAIVCLANGFTSIPDPFRVAPKMFFNITIGLISLLSSIYFGVRWWRARKKADGVLLAMKNKPIRNFVLPETGGESNTITAVENGTHTDAKQ